MLVRSWACALPGPYRVLPDQQVSTWRCTGRSARSCRNRQLDLESNFEGGALVGYSPAHVVHCGSARWDRVFRDRATSIRRGACMCIRSMFAASRRIAAAPQPPIRRRIRNRGHKIHPSIYTRDGWQVHSTVTQNMRGGVRSFVVSHPRGSRIAVIIQSFVQRQQNRNRKSSMEEHKPSAQD